MEIVVIQVKIDFAEFEQQIRHQGQKQQTEQDQDAECRGLCGQKDDIPKMASEISAAHSAVGYKQNQYGERHYHDPNDEKVERRGAVLQVFEVHPKPDEGKGVESQDDDGSFFAVLFREFVNRQGEQGRKRQRDPELMGQVKQIAVPVVVIKAAEKEDDDEEKCHIIDAKSFRSDFFQCF